MSPSSKFSIDLLVTSLNFQCRRLGVAKVTFSLYVAGLISFESSVVAASARVLRANSTLVMLSLRFCFVSPLKAL